MRVRADSSRRLAVLLLTPVALLVRALFGGGVTAAIVGLESGLVLAGGVAAATERERALGASDAPELERGDALDALAVLVAAVLTYWLSVHAGLGPVVASAFVGLVAGLGFPAIPSGSGETLAVVAFCASFVGMSSTERLGGEGRVALAGAVCGLVFLAVAAAFPGAGGKLGTIAFVSCVTTAGAEGLLATEYASPTDSTSR
ncbi:hypothetical protein [Halorussus salinisoli]|uniref:hypothetical protein n=1 Tax=Halorussus salinisoli TaxID=2558242 RepID=UPI0010C187F4|nr:hypothetical protein [Halorussus salinisoli]